MRSKNGIKNEIRIGALKAQTVSKNGSYSDVIKRHCKVRDGHTSDTSNLLG